MCHTTTAWMPATFDHSKTAFPLTGAHTNVACATCHTDDFAGTRQRIATAATPQDFNGTTRPNHVQSGIPQQCQICHNTTAWIPATFDHSQTSFPLTGAHTSVACATCHTDNYAGTLPTNCYGCHAKDYAHHGDDRGRAESRQRRLLARLHAMPHDNHVAECDFQSQCHVVPANGRAHNRRLRHLPHGQLRGDAADELLRLPHEGLQRHGQHRRSAEPRHRQFPAGLHAVPHDDRPG